MRVAVLDDYARAALSLIDWTRLQQRAQVTTFHRLLNASEAAKALEPFDIVCTFRERTPLSGELIASLPRLKLITFVGPPNANIDHAAARANGVELIRAGSERLSGGEASPSTTELTWALILAAQRQLKAEFASIALGGWQSSLGLELRGATLGLLGLGRLGHAMVPIAKAFGLQVIAWSPNLDKDVARAAGVEFVSKNNLFERSDILSVHLVLGERSRGMVGYDDIGRMRRGALLVNTSRGPIIDEKALISAVSTGHIRAALDVFDQEPLPVEHPLRTLPGCTITPHLGFVSREFMTLAYLATRDLVIEWIRSRSAHTI